MVTSGICGKTFSPMRNRRCGTVSIYRSADSRQPRRAMLRQFAAMLAAALWVSSAFGQQPPPRSNWFNDPFFPISARIPNCPPPAGPLLSAEERVAEEHYRAERGTSCWLAGNCDRSSSYAYDQDIGAALQAALRNGHPLPESSLWVTVQRRIVFVEGCVKDQRAAATLAAFMRTIPNVEQVVVNVYAKPGERPPYRLLGTP